MKELSVMRMNDVTMKHIVMLGLLAFSPVAVMANTSLESSAFQA